MNESKKELSRRPKEAKTLSWTVSFKQIRLKSPVPLIYHTLTLFST